MRAERPAYFQVWLDDNVLARSQHLTDTDLTRHAGSLARPGFRSARLPDGRRGRQAGVTFRPQIDLDADGHEESYDEDANTVYDDGTTETSRFTRLTDDRWSRPGAAASPSRMAVEEINPEEADEGSEDFSYGNVEAIDGVAGVMTITWQRADPKITIVVAQETSEIDDRLASLRWILGAVGVAVTLMCLGLLFVVVRRGLDQLRTISQAIKNINAKSLNYRVSFK